MNPAPTAQLTPFRTSSAAVLLTGNLRKGTFGPQWQAPHPIEKSFRLQEPSLAKKSCPRAVRGTVGQSHLAEDTRVLSLALPIAARGLPTPGKVSTFPLKRRTGLPTSPLDGFYLNEVGRIFCQTFHFLISGAPPREKGTIHSSSRMIHFPIQEIFFSSFHALCPELVLNTPPREGPPLKEEVSANLTEDEPPSIDLSLPQSQDEISEPIDDPAWAWVLQSWSW